MKEEKIIYYFISGNFLTWKYDGHVFTYNMSVPEFKYYVSTCYFLDGYTLKRVYHRDIRRFF